MSLATSADVVARLGRSLTAQEAAAVDTLLDDVETKILVRVPDLLAQVNATPPTITKKVVVKAEAWAVIRYARNPDGKYQEAIDDYSFTRDKTVASGELTLTDEEWADILPAGAAASSSAFSIRPTYEPDPA